jgi:hypothetical protein
LKRSHHDSPGRESFPVGAGHFWAGLAETAELAGLASQQVSELAS